jgi:SAM-dependent methyltransferase
VASELTETLYRVAQEIPAAPDGRHGFFTLRNRRNWAERTAHDIDLLVGRIGRHGRVCDVGGGYGLFAVGCAHVGLEAILIDDFFDVERVGMLDSILGLMDRHGVDVRRRDIIADGLDLEPASLDGITCFHVLEHLPFSPKPLFREMAAALRDGGAFLLAGPNAVNLRKRLSVPFGHGAWSAMDDWYETERFRGHVREPSVADFGYIARDLELERVEITGMNFLGLSTVEPLKRRAAAVIDRPLRRWPALCSDLYLLGDKPVQTGDNNPAQTTGRSRAGSE